MVLRGDPPRARSVWAAPARVAARSDGRSIAARQCDRDHRAMTRQPQRYAGGEMVLVIDCADLERAAAFWCEVLGYLPMEPPVGQYMGLTPQDGVGLQLLLQK